jgi:hypothetical protein
MSKILVRTKKENLKDFLISSTGKIIYKDNFVEVDDEDSFIKTYILQDRVELKDIEEEKIKKNDD